PELGGIRRMVNRNDRAVAATIIGGRVVWQDGEFAPGYGAEFAAGRFLPAGEAVGPRPVEASREAAQDLLS
ncbi:MAG TPA: hypothetical protein PKC36_15620, partial [Dietzia sp.]|nr:hypothetical protein [Dietzia sp.]